MTELRFKKLIPEAKAPFKKLESDACFDLFASSMTVESNYLEYGTGIALQIPEGYYVRLYARSSISVTGLILANSVGIIDQTFVSEIMVRFKSVYPYTGHPYVLGDRIAQIELVKMEPVTLLEVTEINPTGRGGFGSSGR